MQEDPTQEKSALERAAERYLQKEAEDEKATRQAVGCVSVGCGLPLILIVVFIVLILVVGGVLTLLGIELPG